MAKKKSAKKTAAAKDFSNSPFKNLKGLSAFEGKKPEVERPLPDKKEEARSASPDDESSFADEMDFLGVKSLSGRKSNDTSFAKDPEPKVSQRSRGEDDQTLFLDALGSMEKVFKDEIPELDSEKRAVPRRMKQVERGILKPEAEVDLHGLTVDEATRKVHFFLQNSVFHGFKTVLIVTGKGLHSNDGPVLRKAIEKLLAGQHDLIIEWGLAPRRYGGEGALMAFLRVKAD